MIIREMTASFGKLANETITLTDGLNVLYAPNEGGKSTWVNFIRAMLYGIPTKERDKADYLAEKNRFQPWGGLPLEGSMKITHQGQHIILRRGPKGAVPFGFFEAIYEDSGEPVPYLTPQGCGEELLGVPRALFERSAFVSQGEHSISSSPELEERIAALVSTGEEISHTVVESRLKSWLNRRRHNKTGIIPALEQEGETLRQGLDCQSVSLKDRSQAQMELGQLVTQETNLQQQLSAQKTNLEETFQSQQQTKQQQWQERYQKATDEVNAAQIDLSAARLTEEGLPSREALQQGQLDLATLNSLKNPIAEATAQLEEEQKRHQALDTQQEAACTGPFGNLSPQEALQRAHQAERTWDDLKPTKGLLVAGILVLLLALACGAYAALDFLALLPSTMPTLPVDFHAISGVAGGLLLLSILLFFLGGQKNRRKKISRRALLARFHVATPEEISPLALIYGENHSRWLAGEQALHNAQSIHFNLTQQHELLTKRLYDLVHTFEPQVTTLFGVSAAISRGLTWEDRCKTATLRYESAKKLLESLPTPEQWAAQMGQGTPAPTQEMVQMSAQLQAMADEKQRLQEVLAHMEGERSALGNPEQFQASLTTLEETLTQRQQEHRALGLAIEVLGEANGELQARFSPHLNASASRYLSALTGGIYTGATLPRTFEPTAKQEGATLPRRAITLSPGTSDQLYLAVRLAICEVLLTPQVPLVLDDVLMAFDDSRAVLALQLLGELGQERQVLLFSCHQREQNWLSAQS